MERVIIDIDETGENVKITVEGCPGPSCKNLTAALERALGKVTKSAPTKELYEAAKTTSRAVSRS